MAFTIIFILWIIAFIGIIIWGNKPYEIDKINFDLPDTFFDLDPEQRKKSLGLAWELGSNQASSNSLRSIGSMIGSGIIMLLCLCISFLDFVCGSMFISSSSPHYTATQEGDNIVSVLLYIGFGLSLILLRSYYSRKKDIDQYEEEEVAYVRFTEKLKNLGVTFVQANYEKWVEQTDAITKSKALLESQVKDVVSFTLFSFDYSLSPSGMPTDILGVTYLFSNGFVSVVSGVVINIKGTSYSYVDSNTPTYSFNTPEEWSTEEFHYSDVVEVAYKPYDGSNDSIKTKNIEHPVEGYLTLSLINSTQKEYPTTKKAVTNYINLAREKVRNAKSSK